MLKQLVFLKKRDDMTMEEFMDYYENHHSQLSKKMGKAATIAGAQRYVRRYLKPEENTVVGETVESGYDCIMEIWWNSRKEFEATQKFIASRVEFIKEDEAKLFSTHHHPVCTVEEYDSPMGPNGEIPEIVVKI